jgi:hypothetical protein
LKKRICVIDGRGGGLGQRLVTGLCLHLGHTHDIIGLGINRAAAAAMERAGATRVAAGAQAIVQTVPTVDVILGSLNVVLPGTMLGQVTQDIAAAVLSARAKKVLLPVNRSQVEVVGAEAQTLDRLIAHSVQRVRSIVAPA